MLDIVPTYAMFMDTSREVAGAYCTGISFMPMLQQASNDNGAERELDMKHKSETSPAPDWLDPRNNRKTPYTDAELDIFIEDFIARMSDTKAWKNLVAEVGGA